MRRILLVLATFVLAAGGTAGHLAGQRGPAPEDTARLEGQAQQAAYRRVLASLEAGAGDPGGDASRAADAGNFRLVWDQAFGHLAVHGGHCRFPLYHADSFRSPLTLFGLSRSDVPQDCAGRDRALCLMQTRLDDYADRYNRVIRADPRFPYADLCAVRMETRAMRQWPSLLHPESLAPASRQETGRPRDIAEAARRGTRGAVRRMLAGLDRAALDRADDFGLTPLAWALIDRRPDIARMLLARGADPLAGRTNPHGRVGAVPLGIALTTGQLDLANEMLTPATRRRLTPWPGPFVEAAAKGGHLALLSEMLAAPGTNANTFALLRAAIDRGPPALWRAIVAGSPDGKDVFLQTAIGRRDPALLREALALRPDVGADGHGRRSPLGNAVQQGGAATDEMARLLLAAGAAPDSPADWARNGYPTDSTAPTALLALVALADRIGPGPRGPAAPEVELRRAAQRRTLDLLLAAGASVHAMDSYGRPLAVLAVTGQYDPRGMRLRDELPIGWLDRLAGAGMDVNATWLGSTALDWADALGMSESATVRALVRLGGRRVKPADLSGGSRF